MKQHIIKVTELNIHLTLLKWPDICPMCLLFIIISVEYAILRHNLLQIYCLQQMQFPRILHSQVTM